MARQHPEPDESVQHERMTSMERLRNADRLSTVGQLVSSIAHELGTPLNVVAGRAKLIAANPNDPEKVRRNAEIIASQIERMTKIIRDLLAFARRKPAPHDRVAVAAVFDEALRLLSPRIERRKIHVSTEGDATAVADIERSRLLQVIMNLMLNSVDATAEGGAIRMDVRATRVATPPVDRASPGEFVEIRVQDSGSGIAAEHQNAIFRPFFSTKPEGEATGLGLSVSDQIVRDQGGWMEVDSSVGEGSTFRVYLPQHARDSEPPRT